MSWIIALLVVGLFILSHSGKVLWAEPSEANGIRCTISVSKQNILPYESIGVLIRLQNETGEPKRPVAAWTARLAIGVIAPEGVTWRGYIPDREPLPSPPIASAILLGPGESKTWMAHLDYEYPGGRHVFARPGGYQIKGRLGYKVKGRQGGYFDCEAMAITVQQPQGIDAVAYEFLNKSDLPKFFSDHTVRKYPYDLRTIQSLEEIIVNFQGSRYSDLARLGVALMWMHVDGGRGDLARARALLTDLSKTAEPYMATQTYYYLGLVAKKLGEVDTPRQYYRIIVEGKSDPYFRYLAEQFLN